MRRLATADAGFEAAFATLLAGRDTSAPVQDAVRSIIAGVRAHGDRALCEYTRRFDGMDLAPETLRVTPAEVDAAVAAVPETLRAALKLAATRIETFHRAQLPRNLALRDAAGLHRHALGGAGFGRALRARR